MLNVFNEECAVRLEQSAVKVGLFKGMATGGWHKRAWLGSIAGLCLAASLGLSAGAQPAADARQAGPVLRDKSGWSVTPTPVAVFGSDDRTSVPPQYRHVQERLGLLYNDKSRTVCSAFCVGEAVIATAAHCLFKTTREQPPRLADFYFARNGLGARDQTWIAGASTSAAAQNVLAGSSRLSVDPPINAGSDWALVRLSKPICARSVFPVRSLKADDIAREARARRIFQISYHRDYPGWRPAYSRNCEVHRSFPSADWNTIQRDFADTGNLVLHTCDTGGASSGSPILLDAPGGPFVVGINVGTYVQSKFLVQQEQMGQSIASDAVANTAVAASAFADRIASFRDAAIITSNLLLRDLQMLLRERGYYEGQVDGAYGPLLRGAIEAYERQAGMPVTGLATESLLVQFGGPLAAAPRRYIPSIGQPPAR